MCDQIDHNMSELKNKTKSQFNIKVGLKPISIGISLTIVVTIVFGIINKYVDLEFQPKDYISIITAGAILTTLFYTSLHLEVNYEANVAKLNFDREKFEYEKERDISSRIEQKREIAFQVSQMWSTPEMAPIINKIRVYLRSNSDLLKSHIPLQSL